MKTFLLLGLAMTIATFSGCANAQLQRQLDDKLSHEPDVKTRTDLRVEVSDLIKNTKSLTDKQKQQLIQLSKATAKRSDELREQAYKLRAVLVKNLLSPNYNSDEIVLLKNRIADVEHERLHLFFTSVHTANDILGRWETKREREDEDFFYQMSFQMNELYF